MSHPCSPRGASVSSRALSAGLVGALWAVGCDSVIGVDDFGQAPTVSTTTGGGGPTDTDSSAAGQGPGGHGAGGGIGGAAGGAPAPEWSRTFGAGVTDRIAALAVQLERHAVVVVGEIGADVVVGSLPLTTHGQRDGLVVELDALGVPTWGRSLGGVGSESVVDVAVVPAGDLVIVGSYDGAPDLDTGALPSAQQPSAFVAKLDGSTGSTVWALGFGSAGSLQRAWAVDAAADGTVVVVGEATGTVVAGALSADCGGPGEPAHTLIAHIGGNGTPIALRCADGPGEHVAFGVAVDSTGRAWVGGKLDGALVLETAELESIGPAGYLLELAADGSPVGAQLVEASGRSAVDTVAVGPSDELYFAGGSAGTIDLGGGALGSPNAAGMFLGALDASGALSWGTWWPAGSATALSKPHCLAADPNGRLVLAGALGGAADFGLGPIESAGETDGLLVRLDADGGVAWATTIGRNDADALRGCAFDGADALLAGGHFAGSIQLAGEVVTSAGGDDALVLRVAP